MTGMLSGEQELYQHVYVTDWYVKWRTSIVPTYICQ